MRNNICYIDEDGRFGGPQQRMLLTVNEITRITDKFHFSFLIPKNEVEIFEKKLRSYNFNYHKKNFQRLSGSFISIIKYLIMFCFELFIICDFVKKNDIAIIQSNSTSQFKGAVASFLTKKKHVWVIEDSSFPLIVVIIFKILAKITKSNIIYTSDRVREFYLNDSFLETNFKREIFAPVDLDYFKKRTKKILNEKKIKVTTVSGLVPVKGLTYFIRAAEILTKKYNNLHFTFTGAKISSQKKYIEKIEKLIKKFPNDRLHYIGMCEDVKKILEETDIFVCSSISEAGPITLYEAISMDIPIVTTDVGSVNQILINNHSAIIVKTYSAIELANGIEKLILNPELKYKFINNAQSSKSFFDLKKVAKKYIGFYNEISN